MEVSGVYGHTSARLLRWSPTGGYVATVSKNRLLVRDVESLQVVRLWSCVAEISDLHWSPDGQYILCVLQKRSALQVWNMEQPDWACRIDEGLAGVSNARWSPDSRHVLTISDFNLRLTIWSLLDKSCRYIKNPKQAAHELDFSKDKRFMALAERQDCKDFINIFDCEHWELLQRFQVDTRDLAEIRWSPDGQALAVAEGVLDYRLFIYSPDGRKLAQYQAYEDQLGIRTIAFSPSGKFLCIGSYDQKARLLNTLSWRLIAELPHNSPVSNASVVIMWVVCADQQQAVYREIAGLQEIDPNSPTKYELVSGPVNIPSIRPSPSKPDPKLGVAVSQWSRDGKWLMTRNENMSNVLWIWEVSALALSAVIIQREAIKVARWSPTETKLVYCTGNAMVYLWSPEGCSCFQIPEPGFTVVNVVWSSQGDCIAVVDKESFCICWIDSSPAGTA